jgi:hypothetical protein
LHAALTSSFDDLFFSLSQSVKLFNNSKYLKNFSANKDNFSSLASSLTSLES